MTINHTRSLYNICGIYRIINKINNKSYIGYSHNIGLRIKQHRNRLNVGKHCNNYLQKAYNKYGNESFIVEVIEEVELENLGSREIELIKEYNTTNSNYGYNISFGGYSSMKGRFASEETKEKMSKAAIGRILTSEDKRKMRVAKLGKRGNRKTSINQYDMNNNFIESYTSITEASRNTNISRTAIMNCLANRSKLSGDFVWRYNNAN